jgi:hypothetical protein
MPKKDDNTFETFFSKTTSDILKCFWSYLDRGWDWSWGGPKEDKTFWKSFFKIKWWTTSQFKTEQFIEKLLIQTSNHNGMIY